MRSIRLVLCAATAAIAPATAQNPDSLAQEFIEFGLSVGHWNPGHAFPDCRAEPWAMDALRRISSADLSTSRLFDLGITTSEAFANCGIQELEDWYFAEMVRFASSRRLYPAPFWEGIALADNPRVQGKLFEWMSADDLPSWFREQSASFYFSKFEGEERLAVFADAYVQGHVPAQSAAFAMSKLVRERPEATLTQLGQLAREQPDRFLYDPAFEVLFALNIIARCPQGPTPDCCAMSGSGCGRPQSAQSAVPSLSGRSVE